MKLSVEKSCKALCKNIPKPIWGPASNQQIKMLLVLIFIGFIAALEIVIG